MTDLRVLFAQDRLCIRAWNEALTLAGAGVQVSLVELQEPTLLGELSYKAFVKHENIPVANDVRSVYRGRRTILEALKRTIREGDYDLVHTHNEPDHFGAWVPRLSSVPSVHDVHDIVTESDILWTKGLSKAVVQRLFRRWESEACRRASALITVSPYMADHFRRKYHLELPHSIENKPARRPLKLLPKLSRTDGKPRVVYAGSLGRIGRMFLDDLISLAKRGIEVHVYPAWSRPEELRDARTKSRATHNFRLHPSVPHEAILREISQYDYGVIWSSDPRDVNNRVSCPNKLHESRVAGLHILTNLNGGYVGDYVTKHDCGLVVDTVDEVPEELPVPTASPPDPAEHFMNSAELVAIYESVLRLR